MFGKKDEMDLAGADRVVDEANRFAVHRAEAEAAISKASRDWHEALEKLGWRQPAGAHDAYPLGARVSHAGKRWISDIDNNVWEPGIAGWSEYVGGDN